METKRRKSKGKAMVKECERKKGVETTCFLYVSSTDGGKRKQMHVFVSVKNERGECCTWMGEVSGEG